MLKGILRATSTILPAAWTEFLVAGEIKDYTRPYIMSRKDREDAIRIAQDKDMDFDYPSETEEEVKERIERTKANREELWKDPWRVVSTKSWREDKEEWDYFYLKGIKSWRTRGSLEGQHYAADVPWDDVVYFPEVEKWKRRIKRYRKLFKKVSMKMRENVGKEMIKQTLYKCPPMTESQAYMILNIEPPGEDNLPDMELVWERYNTLSGKNTPSGENVGSVYLDSKIISAKDYFFEKIPGAQDFEKRMIDESGLMQELKKLEKQEEDETPEWMLELEMAEEQQEDEANEFAQELANGEFVMPRWLEYRYYKVQEMDVRFKLEQKRLMQEEKLKLVERKRKEKEIRLQIQELQDKVDKIVEEEGDPTGIVFPQMPPEEPSKVLAKVDESEQALHKEGQRIRALIRQKFAQEYEIDPTFSMFEGETTIEEESQLQAKLEFDYNDELEKREILCDKK